jgi:hypothetical protein
MAVLVHRSKGERIGLNGSGLMEWKLRWSLAAAVCVMLAWNLRAGDLMPPASERFAAAGAQETPDFQRHVLPLLGRFGCNGRACHGSFQGQGGFPLSLFGYDFKADHEALLGGDEPRVDLKEPAKSLILQKPTLAIDHDGGQRYKNDGWEYQLLRRWIQAGAPPVAVNAVELLSIELDPQEILFAAAGRTQSLKVVAHWSDGTREDVTPLCRFRTNDESIAQVNESGLITSVGKGDTHIVAFYDNGTVSVPVGLPVSDLLGPRYPKVAAPTRIDELVVAKLRKLGVVPSDICTDAEFLRRVSLDMTGTLPRPDEVAAFLADGADDKRARKIDELLARPAYAAWWTTRLCDWTGNGERNLPEGGEQGLRRDKSALWYDWIYRRVAENTPYDRLVEGLVLAVSRTPGQTEEQYFVEMSAYFREKDPADFSMRASMPYFWSGNRFTPPQPLRFSYAFLGIRLECAQCHKHPYDQWTKDDYEQFQAFFDGIRQGGASGGLTRQMKQDLGLIADQDSGAYKGLFAKLVREGRVVPWQEVTAPSWKANRGRARPSRNNPTGRVFTPKLLGGEEVIATQYDDPREPLMEWLRQPANPYFARALVNRVWANYFGVGIVEPPDDMNLANPPSNRPLLDDLAERFIASGYDLKWLHCEIATSNAYQRTWRPTATNRLDERNFSHAQIRRLPAELAYDALVHAAASTSRQQALHEDRAAVRQRAIGVSSGYSRNYDGSYALKLFGKPERAVSCECERSNEPSVLQTVYLRNDGELLSLLDDPSSWVREISATEPPPVREELIRTAYLRTVSRPPTAAEMAAGMEHLAQAKNLRSGL